MDAIYIYACDFNYRVITCDKTDMLYTADEKQASETSGSKNFAEHENKQYECTEGFAKDLEGHGSDYLKFQLEKV